MRGFSWISIVITVMACGLAAVQACGADDQEATKKLGVFVGKWQSEGTIPETRFSHADKISSSMDCGWSPQHNFLICEQLITTSTGKTTQLAVYSYSAKDGNYTVTSIAGPGAQAGNGTVVINGNVWSYPSSYVAADGKQVGIRTTNDFSVPGTDSFKTEFSDDLGAHWTVTLQGTGHKIEP